MNTDYLKKCAAKLLTEKQMSEAFLNNMFLALSGGLQDAYTYNVRDHVFSNAQTGNVVLMSQHIISGDMRSALRYLVPLVSFVLGERNMLATVLVSFACAMQVQSFRKVGGYSYASTMCIGNLRSGTTALTMYFEEHKPEQLRQFLYYFGIIFFFAIGAGAGGVMSLHFGITTIWGSSALLLVSFLLMFLERLR